ncbi:MAG: cell division protein SepF [Candidatus Thermoplasmatota archaeon]|nr:cell division protein SepF [Candidatus Thermoplasmatota archaeon]
MGIASKIFGEKKTGTTEGYIDLEKYADAQAGSRSGARMHVAIGEIQRYEDLKELTDFVYGGNVLILDFAAISDQEVLLKRVTNELKRITDDIGGDVAGIGNNLMVVSPNGVKVERRKLKGKF